MNQHLEKRHSLNQTQIAHVRQLEEVVNQFEGLATRLNWNRLKQSKNEINDFLCYDGDRLIGYLALYTFNPREAEINAMTHPDYRRRGIFKGLLAEARLELKKRHIPSLLFICEQASTSGLQCMKAMGANYEFSEYKLILREPVKISSSSDLQLRPAQPGDLLDLAHMEALCFDLALEETQQHLKNDLADSQRRVFVATSGEEKIGKIHVSLAEETFLFAFCVLPEYRGRGYGKTILSRTVEQLVAEQRPDISLEVESNNQNALSLYEKCGFQIATAYDYYRQPVDI